MSDTVDTSQALDVGDAVLRFQADTTNLDVAFNRVADEAAASMGKAAGSVSQIGDALDATGDNMAYAGDNFGKLTKKISDGSTKAADDAANAGKKIDYSFREARGGIMLMMDDLGVHLPRELTMLLAHIAPIGMAFEMMLPILGVVAAIKVIGELIEKHEALIEAQRHATQQSESLEIKQHDLAVGLENANLQLEDQIRKLEGRPAVNTLTLALMAVKHSVDDLATTYASDFQKMDNVIENQMHLWARLKRGASDALAILHEFSTEGMMGPDTGQATARIKANNEEVASLKALTAAEDKLDEARRKLSDEDPTKDMEKWKAAATAVAVAAGNVQSAADTAREAVKKVQPDAAELLGTLRDKATLAKGEWQSMAAEITRVGLEARKANQDIANASAERQVTASKQALDAQLAAIETWKSAQHAAYEAGKADLSSWLAAEMHATDAAAIAHEDSLRRIIAIYKQAGEVEKQRAAEQELATLQTKNAALETEKLAAAEQKHQETTRKVIAAYGELVDANVARDFEGAQKAVEKLTGAEDELLKAQSKLAEDKLSAYYKDQEAAITRLAQMHLITEEQKNDRLKLLEQQQATAAIEILTDQLAKEKAVMDAAQGKVDYAKSNPFTVSPAQLAELEASLDKVKTTYTNTEAQLVETQDKFNRQSESEESAHNSKMLAEGGKYFQQALLEAMGFGQQLLAEQLKQNRAALLAAEGEEKQAKARGANTDAIRKEIEALKENEKALEKEASGGRITQAEKLKNVHAALAAAEAVFAEAKAHGADTTAMEQNVRQLQQLEKATQQVTTGDKALLAQMLLVNKAQLLAAQQILLLAKDQGLDTTAIEQNIKALKQQLVLLNQENQKLPETNKYMMEFRTTMQQAATTMVSSFASAMEGVIKGQESFGAAMEKATIQMIGQMAQHWAEYFIGLAIANMWSNPAAAAGEFAGAAALEALSGVMSGLASGVGGGSSAATQAGPTPGQTISSGAGGGSNQNVGVTKLAEGGIVSKPTMVQPNVMAGDSPSGGEADEAILPLSDPTAMNRISKALAPGGEPQNIPQSGIDSDSIDRMTKAIAALTGTRDTSGFQSEGSTADTAKPDFRFGTPSPSAHQATGFTSGEPSPGEKPSFASAAPSEIEKTDFIGSQPTVSDKPTFNANSPTVGEALGFKFDTPYPGDKPVFSSGEPSAPDKPGFSLAAPSANTQRDFAASSPTVGEAFGFGFSSPAPSYEGLGFTTGQQSTSAKPGFSSGVQTPSEKLPMDIAAPSAGERPGFNYSAPSVPREMPDMEAMAANFGGLLSQPTLRAASQAQAPAAAVSASSAGNAPVDIESRMEKFAERLGAQMQPEGRSSTGSADGEGGDIHLHMPNLKGIVSPESIKKVFKVAGRMVKNRQMTVKASDSLRLTRRSQ